MSWSTKGALLLGVWLSAASAARADIVLEDRAAQAGLGALLFHGITWHSAGVAFADLDGDGWPDLYFGAAQNETDQLCLNRRDGTFACAPVGAVNPGDVLAVAAGDYDRDGDLDLYVMRNGPNSLYQNDGHGHFTDVTARTHADGAADRITPSGTFFDYDGDGRLDLYLGHWYASEPEAEAVDQVLHQEPDGTFTDETLASRVDDQLRSTLAMISFDYDGDRRPDLFVSSDFDQALLFHNEGGGRFSDATPKQSYAFHIAVNEGMGLAAGDLNGDGLVDFYVTGNRSSAGALGSALMLNNGDGTFTPRTNELGVAAAFAWGVGIVDFDNDSWPDIFVATDVLDHHFLYRSLGGQSFAEEDIPGILQGKNNCVTAAFADYDGDGRVDVVLHRLDGMAPQLLHNETPGDNHFVQVALVGDPLGATVRVSTGARSQERELIAQSSKGSQSERRFTFGLGTARAADVQVTFPDGTALSLPNLAADHSYVVGPNGIEAMHTATHAGCSVAGHAPQGGWVLFLLALSIYVARRIQPAAASSRENSSTTS